VKSKNTSNDNMLVIIPARGGSKGVPRKNIKLLAGRPLIDYTIKAALAAKKVSRVIVDTEDKEIANIAIECGAEVPFMRPDELATDTVSNGVSCLHLIDRLNESGHDNYNEFVMIQATSPFINSDDIDNAIMLYRERKPIAVVSLRPLETPLESICEINDKGYIKSVAREYLKNDFIPNQRQGYKDRYAISGAITVLSTEHMQKDINYYYGNPEALALVLENERGHDIDTIKDFIIAEYLVEQLNIN
jgi:CMP-N,N'-diacetyllegionaminic acid synthase